MFDRETKELTIQCAGVLAGEGEAIHQFRICVRRLRGLIELYQPLLQRDWGDRHRKELKFLGHSVGSLRDTDVLQQNLSDAAAKIDESLRDALGPLQEALAERRREQHKSAITLLRSARYEAVVRELPAVAFKQAPSVEDRVASSELIRPLVRAVERGGAKLGRSSSPGEFHRLRIRIKRLRYALEMLDDVEKKPAKSVAKKLKRVQDILGLQHDLVTAVNWLREVTASTTMPAATLLAAGAVYQVLHRRILKLLCRGWKRSKTIRSGAILRDVIRAVPDTIQRSGRTHKADAA
ncbi:MAG: CHAD domain-containing protein [Deltaproteobacteria bacterium]|nr:CHAD domain-containing protein [Deltaproteobacteria bacterium]